MGCEGEDCDASPLITLRLGGRRWSRVNQNDEVSVQGIGLDPEMFRSGSRLRAAES